MRDCKFKEILLINDCPALSRKYNALRISYDKIQDEKCAHVKKCGDKKTFYLVYHNPFSSSTSPVKAVHLSNALAVDTNAILDDSTSFLVTAKHSIKSLNLLLETREKVNEALEVPKKKRLKLCVL